MHAVVLLTHCLSSLLRYLRRARVVSRPAEWPEKEMPCRSSNEEWSRFSKSCLRTTLAGSKFSFIGQTSRCAAPTNSKQMRNASCQASILRTLHFERLKTRPAIRTSQKELSHVGHACTAAAKKDARGPISLLLRAVISD